MSDLYRRRLIPDECLHLKNDHIIHISKDIIVTKWNTIHPKAEFSHGISIDRKSTRLNSSHSH